MSSPVTNHILLDVHKGVEVLASECCLSCLMLTTYCLKAIVSVVTCCAYAEVVALSINDNVLYAVSLAGCEMLPFYFYETKGSNCGKN